MKTVILCGGYGTRLSEETGVRPKPMVTVGGHPLLWHLLHSYAHFNHKEFVLALGYLGEYIKDYFQNFYTLNSDFEVDLATGQIEYAKISQVDWKVRLVDTGLQSLTGERLRRLEPILRPEGTFFLTYGDGLADIDLDALLAFHRSHGKIATITAVKPTARFGGMAFDGDRVIRFQEKPQGGEGWINGGFFVFEPSIFDYLTADNVMLEHQPIEDLAANGELMAYRHEGFWQCMDTLRDRQLLEELWAKEQAPWWRG